jgi:hypothetical protein
MTKKRALSTVPPQIMRALRRHRSSPTIADVLDATEEQS